MKKNMDKSEVVDGTVTNEEEPRVFAKLTMDKVFKIVLGNPGKEELLMELINIIIPELKLVGLTYLPTERLGLTAKERKSIFDVYARDSEGRHILIEMQMWTQNYYNKRAIYYGSLSIQDQARKEQKFQREELKIDWDYYYKPVYIINFLNFANDIVSLGAPPIFPYLAHYGICSTFTGSNLDNDVNWYFIDLNLFNKEFEECNNDFEEWIYSIKNMHKLKEIPQGAIGKSLEKLYNEAEIASWSPEERNQYEKYMSSQGDFNVSLREQVAAGVERGRKEGKKEGRVEERATIVQQLVESGFTTKAIAKALKMPVKEINALLSRC